MDLDNDPTMPEQELHTGLSVAAAAANVLGQIGYQAKDAVPQLLKSLRHPEDWRLRREAAYALSNIASTFDLEKEEDERLRVKVVLALMGSMFDPHEEVRAAAIERIGRHIRRKKT